MSIYVHISPSLVSRLSLSKHWWWEVQSAGTGSLMGDITRRSSSLVLSPLMVLFPAGCTSCCTSLYVSRDIVHLSLTHYHTNSPRLAYQFCGWFIRLQSIVRTVLMSTLVIIFIPNYDIYLALCCCGFLLLCCSKELMALLMKGTLLI
jgi:hypothetical protein